MEAVGEGKGLYQRICLPTWPVILCIFGLFQMHIIQAGHVEDLEHAGKKKQNCASQGKFYTVYIHIPCFTPEIKKISTSGTDVI